MSSGKSYRWLRWVFFTGAMGALIFLSAGFINPVVEYKASVEIDHSRSEVWDLFHTDSLIDRWMPEVDSIALVSGTPGEAGAVYRLWMSRDNRSFSIDRELTAFRPPEFIAMHYRAFSMKKTDTFTFTSENGKTSVTGRYKVRGATFLNRCLYAFMGSYFKQVDRKYLDQFKSLAEEKL